MLSSKKCFVVSDVWIMVCKRDCIIQRACGIWYISKFTRVTSYELGRFPDSKLHWANMGPTWVLSAPDGPHVGPTNLAIMVASPFPAVYHCHCVRVAVQHPIPYESVITWAIRPTQPVCFQHFVATEGNIKLSVTANGTNALCWMDLVTLKHILLPNIEIFPSYGVFFLKNSGI